MSLKSPWHKLRNKATVRSPNLEPNEDEDWYAEDDEPVLPGESERKRRPACRRAYVAALAAALVLILGTAAVTYSYLMASSDVVVNTFAGGAISLTLDEAKVDTDGNPLEDEPRVQENTYKVVPGTTLYKDPTVTVLEGSEVCYVFLYVENPLDEDYFTFDYSSDWIEVATTGTKTLYVYKTTVDASEGDVVLTPIFTTITVSSDLTSAQIEAMGEVQIKVQAYAIQAEGVDSETGIRMAADYFEEEFDFSWDDVDTAVDLDGLTTEENNDSEEEDDSEEEEDSEEEDSDEEDDSGDAEEEDDSEEEDSDEEGSEEEESEGTEDTDTSSDTEDEESSAEDLAEEEDTEGSSDSDGTTSDDTTTDNTDSSDTGSDTGTGDGTVSDGTTSDGTTTDDTTSDGTTTDDTDSSDTGSDTGSLDGTTSDGTTSDGTTSDDTASDGTTSDDTTSDDTGLTPVTAP